MTKPSRFNRTQSQLLASRTYIPPTSGLYLCGVKLIRDVPSEPHKTFLWNGKHTRIPRNRIILDRSDQHWLEIRPRSAP